MAFVHLSCSKAVKLIVQVVCTSQYSSTLAPTFWIMELDDLKGCFCLIKQVFDALRTTMFILGMMSVFIGISLLAPDESRGT